MFFQEVEYHVAASPDIRGIHRNLAEEILHLGVDNRQSSQTVPKIVESKDALGVCAHVLILKRHE